MSDKQSELRWGLENSCVTTVTPSLGPFSARRVTGVGAMKHKGRAMWPQCGLPAYPIEGPAAKGGPSGMRIVADQLQDRKTYQHRPSLVSSEFS